MPAAVGIPRLLPVEEARRIVLDQAAPLETEQVPLADSLGRVLAKDLMAEVCLPPFDNSAMDGYALRAAAAAQALEDRPVKLQLVGEVAAGDVLDRTLGQGEAVKIMTGAPLPPGADSVVMLEEARLRNGMVELRNPVPLGSHVRKAGEDIHAGHTALSAGTRVGLQHLGLLAGLGYASLPVSRLPRVAIMATGSELVDIGEPLVRGKIRNSNSLVLAALLRRLGVQPRDLGRVVDDRALIQRKLEEAASASDVMLISGGVSVGEHDLVKRVLRDLGMETLFWRVNMKPGKPLLVGRWGDRMVFGLPGNPISCVVCFVEFIAPFLRTVMGERDAGVRVRARLTQPIRKKEPRLQLLTARLQQERGTLHVAPTPQQGSGMLSSLAGANAFIVMPEEAMRLEAGALIEVVPFGDEPWRW